MSSIESYSREIVEELEDYAVFLLDDTNLITSCNTGSLTIFGYTPAELTGKPIEVLFSPEDQQNIIPVALVQEVKSIGKSTRECWLCSKNKNKIWAKIVAKTVAKGSENNCGLLFIIHDLTPGKMADERLRIQNTDLQQQCNERTATITRNEHRFRSLLENNYDFITLKDKNGKVLYQSPAIEKMIGYSVEETEGKNGEDFFHPDEMQDVVARMEKAMSRPGVPVWGLNRMKHKDGHYIWVEGTTTNMLENENVQAIVGNFRDVTARILAEIAIEKNRQELSNSYHETETLLNHIDEVFVVLNKDFEVISFNSNAETHVWKYLNKQIKKGEKIFEFLSPDLKDGFESVLKEVLLGAKKEVEIAYHDDTNQKHYYLNLIKPTINADGVIEGIFITKRNITQRVADRAKIEFDQNNLDALINNTYDLMWSVDLEKNLITSNRAFDEMVKRMTGLATIDQDNLGLGFSVAQNNRWNDWYLRAFAGETFTEIEYTDQPFEYWSEVSFHPIYDQEKVIGTACYAHDITKIKKAEAQNRQNELRLKQAQAIAQLGNWELNFADGRLYWSEEHCRIYGLAPDDNEQTFESWISFIHPDDLDYVRGVVDELEKSKGSAAFKHRIITKNGNERYISTYSQFNINDRGVPIGMFGVAQDITQAKEAEESLAQSEANLRLIMDLIPHSIFSRDIKGNYIFVNHYFAHFYGLNPQDLINKNISETFREIEEQELYYNQDREIILSGESKVFNNVTVKDFTGNIHYFDVCKVPYRSASKKEMAVLAVAIEITDRVHDEEEKSKMLTELIQRNKDLEQFSYIVSHNLRAPVSNIIGIVEILQIPGLTREEETKVMKQLTTSVVNLDTVIKDLNFILQVKNEINNQKEIVHFSDILNDIKLSINNLIKIEKVTITSDFSAVDEMVTLKSYLYSIFFNLISNSIKYRQPDIPPVITITSSHDDGKIIISFKDNGLGIDLKKKGDQVFGLYKRFHSHTEGKGMGLYMVKTQVKTLGGSVLIISEVNNGTEITLQFDINK